MSYCLRFESANYYLLVNVAHVLSELEVFHPDE